MATETEVRVTVDEQLARDASAIYAELGMTTSEALRAFLVRTVREGVVSFEPIEPNAETIEAMSASRRGDVVRVGSVDDLMAELRADD